MELKVKGCENENISIYKTKNHPKNLEWMTNIILFLK